MKTPNENVEKRHLLGTKKNIWTPISHLVGTSRAPFFENSKKSTAKALKPLKMPSNYAITPRKGRARKDGMTFFSCQFTSTKKHTKYLIFHSTL